MSILEITRSNQEELETLEESAAQLLLHRTQKHHFLPSDLISDYISTQMQSRAKKVIDFMEDRDSARQDEVSNMAGEGSLDVWHSFYSRIKAARDISRQSSDVSQVCFDASFRIRVM